MLRLLKADYFASYTWDADAGKFVSRVQINMSDDNLELYEKHYQFCDPITPQLQRRRQATPVRNVLDYDRLHNTEYYNDFLARDGLVYGLNYFAYDLGNNIGDLRIWRGKNREDFGETEIELLNALGPSFVNALVRAGDGQTKSPPIRFSQIQDLLGLTQRETEVADLLAVGMSDEEVCAKLNISKPTLRTHISSLFRKTGINRRAQVSTFLNQKFHQK